MQDLAVRRAILEIIEDSLEKVREGQKDLFISKRRIPKVVREDYENFFAFMRKRL